MYYTYVHIDAYNDGTRHLCAGSTFANYGTPKANYTIFLNMLSKIVCLP